MGIREAFILGYCAYMVLALFAASRYQYRETYSFVVIPILHPVQALAFGVIAAPLYLLLMLFCSFVTTLVLYVTIMTPPYWLLSFVPGLNLVVRKIFHVKNRDEMFPRLKEYWVNLGKYWDEIWKER